MHIIKATETIPVEHPVFCLFGQPGIGKSSLGYSAATPLLLDFDGGAHRAANRRDTLQITTWADVTELMNSPETLAPYTTVVVDTVGRCLDLMSADILTANPKMGTAGNLSLQGYGVLKTRFRGWVTQLRTFGKDVLLICHEKEDKDGDTRIVRPDITGGSYGEVMKVSDFVGFLYMAGKHRILDFNPTERWTGKNPGNWLPIQVPPVEKAQAVMAGLIEKGRAALGLISAESATIAHQVEAWRAAVAGYTTVDDINRAVGQTATLAPILAPQAKKLLMDRAKALGFVWNPASKAFAAPQPQAVAS